MQFLIIFTNLMLLGSIVHCSDKVLNAPENIPFVQLNTNEAFYFSVNEKVFNNSEAVVNEFNPIKYRPSLLSMPDLPKWMKFFYSENYHDGYLYGIPTKPGDFMIEVVATNMESFETNIRTVHLFVKPRRIVAKYEVQMKFSNLNVDDVFIDDHLERLVEIFSRRLWKNGKNIHVTLVDSAVQLGGRRPPNPKEKDGVIVRIGSTESFSLELKNLEREVMTIRNREPCPKDYKKTSAERFFRDEEFIPDWCGFRLIYDNHRSDNARISSSAPILLTSDDFHPPDRNLPHNYQRLGDFLMCLILPTISALLLAGVLSWIMFGRREGVEKRNLKTPNIQMVQYASIHRASANLRGMNTTRNGPTPLATTPNSTLHRSPANSPNNTILK